MICNETLIVASMQLMRLQTTLELSIMVIWLICKAVYRIRPAVGVY